MTQGKIERWHQTLKNRILLENYYLPGDLETQIRTFVEYYNHQRYHESISNLTPADVYCGRAQIILLKRERIKHQTIERRRFQHRKNAASNDQPDEPETPLNQNAICLKNSDDGQSSLRLHPRGLQPRWPLSRRHTRGRPG